MNQKQFLTGYFLGGGAFVLFVGEVAAACFHIEFAVRHRYQGLQLGRPHSVQTVAIIAGVFSVLGALFLLIAFLARILSPDRRSLHIPCWVLGYLSACAVIVCESIGLDFTKYLGYPILSHYRIDTSDELAAYVHEFETAVPPYYRGDAINWSHFPLIPSGGYSLDDFLQPYYELDDTNLRRIPACAIDWQAVTPTDDPCTVFFGRVSNAQCLGSWTPPLLGEYWCDQYTQKNEDDAFALEHANDLVQVEKRLALRQRRLDTVESMGAFYQNSRLLLGIQVTGFVISVVSVCVDGIFHGKWERPYDAIEGMELNKDQAPEQGMEAEGDAEAPKPKDAGAPVQPPAAVPVEPKRAADSSPLPPPPKPAAEPEEAPEPKRKRRPKSGAETGSAPSPPIPEADTEEGRKPKRAAKRAADAAPAPPPEKPAVAADEAPKPKRTPRKSGEADPGASPPSAAGEPEVAPKPKRAPKKAGPAAGTEEAQPKAPADAGDAPKPKKKRGKTTEPDGGIPEEKPVLPATKMRAASPVKKSSLPRTESQEQRKPPESTAAPDRKKTARKRTVPEESSGQSLSDA